MDNYQINYPEWLSNIAELENVLIEHKIIEKISMLPDQDKKRIINYCSEKNCVKNSSKFETKISLGNIIRLLLLDTEKKELITSIIQFITECCTPNFVQEDIEKEKLIRKVILALCSAKELPLEQIKCEQLPEILNVIALYKNPISKLLFKISNPEKEYKKLKQSYILNLRGTPVRDIRFSQLANIADLCLENCNFTELPKNLFQLLTRLKKLNLSKNSLTELPQILEGQNYTIKTLNLSHNKLKNMPSFLFYKNCPTYKVDLSNNKIKIFKLPRYSKNSPRIFLNISNNPINKIKESIIDSKVKVFELLVENLPLEVSPDVLKKILPHCSLIHTLSLKNTMHKNPSDLLEYLCQTTKNRVKNKFFITNLTFGNFENHKEFLEAWKRYGSQLSTQVNHAYFSDEEYDDFENPYQLKSLSLNGLVPDKGSSFLQTLELIFPNALISCDAFSLIQGLFPCLQTLITKSCDFKRENTPPPFKVAMDIDLSGFKYLKFCTLIDTNIKKLCINASPKLLTLTICNNEYLESLIIQSPIIQSSDNPSSKKACPLQEIYLSNNKLSNFKDIKTLFTIFKKLKSVDLNRNQFPIKSFLQKTTDFMIIGEKRIAIFTKKRNMEWVLSQDKLVKICPDDIEKTEYPYVTICDQTQKDRKKRMIRSTSLPPQNPKLNLALPSSRNSIGHDSRI